MAVGEISVVDDRGTRRGEDDGICFLDVLVTGDVVDLIVVNEGHAEMVVESVAVASATND